MKTMHYGKVLTAALSLLLAAALTLAGCQGAATAPPDPVSPSPAEESSGAAPESSSQPAAPAEPEPETSAPEPPAESSSQPEETPPQSGASGPAAPAPESAGTPPPSSESQGTAGGTSGGYGQPEGMPPAEALPDNPLPPPAVNGVYDRPDRVYGEGYVAPNDQNNPYHFDFSGSESFYGVPVNGWIDEHAFVWGNDDLLYWWPFMDSGTNIGGSVNG